MNWKEEAVRQWSADPCGAVEGPPFGSPEFFRSVEVERYEHYAPWMRDAMGFDRRRGQRVLEVGCGLGTDLASFARGGAETVGIDLTERHLRATAKRLRMEGRPVRLVRGDAERLPFRPGSFDAVYSFGVIHHTPDTRGAVAEIRRVLKKGGEAIVGLYHRDSLFFWAYCVGIQGILRGGFLRFGYHGTLSFIEQRKHSDARPLVKVYSRSGARRLFAGFGSVDVKVEHFQFRQSGRLGRILGRYLGRWEDKVAHTLGWYVVVRAETPKAP